MDVQLPNGQILRGVPDGTTRAQLAEKLTANGISLDAPKSETGLIDRIKQDYQGRLKEGQNAADAYVSGQQSLPLTYLDFAGKIGAGTAADVIGESVKSAASYAPQGVKDAVSNVVSSIASSPVGAAARAVGDKYQDFAQRHPNAARHVEAAANIGGMLAPEIPIKGKTLAGAAVDTATAGAKAVGGAAADVASAAASKAAPTNLYKGFKARDVEQLTETAQAIKERSSKAYQTMRDSGATFKPDFSSKLVMDLNKSLSMDGPLNSHLHGKAMGVFDDFKTAVSNGDVDLEGLDQWRRVFGEVASETQDHRPTPNARKASLLINAIDDTVDRISPKDLSSGGRQAIDALHFGRKEWARARKFETVSDIVRKSDGDANYLKRELKKLADNPKKVRGFSPEEVSALREASKLSAGEGILKMLGKFGVDFGNSRIGNTALPVIGGLVTGGGTLPVVGTAARQAQKWVARGKAEKLLNTIEGNPTSMEESIKSADLSRRHSNSPMGKFMAENADIPISSLKDIPPEVMQEIMKMSPKDAREALRKLKGK